MIIAKRKWESPVPFSADPAKGEVIIELCWPGYWVVKSGGFSACFWNPIKAVVAVIEREAAGMAKYTRLKERCRSKGYWQTL